MAEVVYTNGKVALTLDLVFGLSVYSDQGWVPWSELDEADRDMIRKLLDWDISCPEDWRKKIYSR